MFKRLLFALLLTLVATSANAQTCPTRPPGDNSNACASTAFVHNATPVVPFTGAKCDGAVFLGSQSGTTLTVSEMLAGTLARGATLYNAGTAVGTVSFTGTGTGKTGTYG